MLGDCSLVDDILDEKRVKSVRWAPAHFANTFLRAVGQVRQKRFIFRLKEKTTSKLPQIKAKLL